MKSKQIWIISGLILTFLVSAAGLAGAGILDNASQIVNLSASSSSATVVPLSAFARVTPGGTSIAFDPGSSVVVVINKIMWKFKPDNTQITNPVQLRLTAIPFSPSSVAFYGKKSSVGGDGYAFENDNIAPGIPVDVQDASIWGFYVVDLVTNQPISGSLAIRLVGFMTPNQ
jgi:hypothetical protein